MHGGKTWEIDVFHGLNQGLVVAEVELTSEDEAVELPAWAVMEASHDPRWRQRQPAETTVQHRQ